MCQNNTVSFRIDRMGLKTKQPAVVQARGDESLNQVSSSGDGGDRVNVGERALDI